MTSTPIHKHIICERSQNYIFIAHRRGICARSRSCLFLEESAKRRGRANYCSTGRCTGASPGRPSLSYFVHLFLLMDGIYRVSEHSRPVAACSWRVARGQSPERRPASRPPSRSSSTAASNQTKLYFSLEERVNNRLNTLLV